MGGAELIGMTQTTSLLPIQLKKSPKYTDTHLTDRIHTKRDVYEDTLVHRLAKDPPNGTSTGKHQTNEGRQRFAF
jgi:hypothetical protein